MIAFACFVAWVIDGDTLICRGGTRVRLAGIDAPELHGCEPAGRTCVKGDGRAALHALIGLAKGRAVACDPVGKSYERVLAFCRVGGSDLGCAMVRGGYAVRRYSFGVVIFRKPNRRDMPPEWRTFGGRTKTRPNMSSKAGRRRRTFSGTLPVVPKVSRSSAG